MTKHKGNPKFEGRSSNPETSVAGRLQSATPGFTLIELLVVIAVIALLAAMIIPITGKVTQMRIRNRARGEMENLITAITSYKAKYGFYPPDNPGYPTTNQLFFELVGTTLNAAGKAYATKDGSAQVTVATISSHLNGQVTGFMNSTKGAASDDGQQAKAFLTNLKPSQKAEVPQGSGFYVLVGKPDWPNDPNFPIAGSPAVNPWRYVSTNPVHNRNEFDLWIDVVVGGNTNRICNWTKQVLINPP